VRVDLLGGVGEEEEAEGGEEEAAWELCDHVEGRVGAQDGLTHEHLHLPRADDQPLGRVALAHGPLFPLLCLFLLLLLLLLLLLHPAAAAAAPPQARERRRERRRRNECNCFFFFFFLFSFLPWYACSFWKRGRLNDFASASWTLVEGLDVDDVAHMSFLTLFVDPLGATIAANPLGCVPVLPRWWVGGWVGE